MKEKLKLLKKVVALTMVFTMIIPMIRINNISNAATFADINKAEVFLKQKAGSEDCVLVASAMLIRRASILAGKSNWRSVTADAIRGRAVDKNGLLNWEFDYNGIYINHGILKRDSSNRNTIISLLSKHPEGIVAFDGNQPHGILITDYTNGIFYCADPDTTINGRVPLSKIISIKGSNQEEKIARFNAYWYVISPKLSLTGGGTSQPAYTYTNISGEYYLKNENNGKYLTVDGFADADKANISTANYSSEKQKVTVTSTGGNNHKIVPACTSRLVNAWGNNPTSGANVNLYHFDSSNSSSQLWKFEKVGDKMYRIHLAYNEELCLAISGTNVTVQNITNNSQQRWILEPVHTHNYNTLVECGKSHPHYNYYKCSCGATRIEITETNSYNSCSICKGRVKYNANGGVLSSDAIATANINGTNIQRSAGYRVVYTQDFGTKTATNYYGAEFAFNANGEHIATRNYEEKENLAIPSGGFVLSVNSDANIKLFSGYLSNAKYAYYDTNEKIVYFYKTKEDYIAGTKFLTNGNKYGELPIPEKEGYIFDGWYTQASGGEKITSTSTFNGVTQLYAQWTQKGNEDFDYIVENGEVTITKYKGTKTEVIIPSTIEGKKVIEIGDGAFKFCGELTSVTISEGIKKIGREAFYYCDGLNTITLPESLIMIESMAFQDCRSLTNITIPENVKSIGSFAFAYCSELESITIPKKIDTIEAGAFYYAHNLKNINVSSENDYYLSEDGILFNKDKTTLVAYPYLKEGSSYVVPSSVTNIEKLAFAGSQLENIELPAKLINIGEMAFDGCEIKSVEIPSSVNAIGQDAFGQCFELTRIEVDSNNQNYLSENGVLFNKDKTKLLTYPIGKKDISYEIPTSVTSIEAGAFYADINLKNLTILENVVNIDFMAFNGYSSAFTIYGHKGSYIEQYANDNNIKFMPIGEGRISTTLIASNNIVNPSDEFKVVVNINGLKTITDGIIAIRWQTRV